MAKIVFRLAVVCFGLESLIQSFEWPDKIQVTCAGKFSLLLSFAEPLCFSHIIYVFNLQAL